MAQNLLLKNKSENNNLKKNDIQINNKLNNLFVGENSNIRLKEEKEEKKEKKKQKEKDIKKE